jgi:hypothetical protein
MTLEFRKDGTFTQTTIVGGECPGKYEIDRSGIIVIGFDDPNDSPGGKGFRMLTRAGDALIDEDGKRWEKQ